MCEGAHAGRGSCAASPGMSAKASEGRRRPATVPDCAPRPEAPRPRRHRVRGGPPGVPDTYVAATWVPATWAHADLFRICRPPSSVESVRSKERPCHPSEVALGTSLRARSMERSGAEARGPPPRAGTETDAADVLPPREIGIGVTDGRAGRHRAEWRPIEGRARRHLGRSRAAVPVWEESGEVRPGRIDAEHGLAAAGRHGTEDGSDVPRSRGHHDTHACLLVRGRNPPYGLSGGSHVRGVVESSVRSRSIVAAMAADEPACLLRGQRDHADTMKALLLPS